MPRRELREGRRFPAEDFGYQHLVGFGAQSPPRPTTRRKTQHNCLLIRTLPPLVTGDKVFRPIYALGNQSMRVPRQIARLVAHLYHDAIYLFDEHPDAKLVCNSTRLTPRA